VQLLQPRRFGRPSTVYRDRTTMELLKTYLDHFLQLTGSDHSSQRMVELSERYGLFPNPQTSISHIGKQVRRAATNSVPNQFQSDSDPRSGSTCAWTIRQSSVSMSWHMGRADVTVFFRFISSRKTLHKFCFVILHAIAKKAEWIGYRTTTKTSRCSTTFSMATSIFAPVLSTPEDRQNTIESRHLWLSSATATCKAFEVLPSLERWSYQHLCFGLRCL